MNHTQLELLQRKQRTVLCFCSASQHCRQPPAAHCLRENVRRCDTATSCNYQQFKRVRQSDL